MRLKNSNFNGFGGERLEIGLFYLHFYITFILNYLFKTDFVGYFLTFILDCFFGLLIL